METSESILGREVVVFDECKRVGKVLAVVVHAKARCVAHLVIKNPTAGSLANLPFSNVIAVGDSFVTVESKHDLQSVGVSKDAVSDFRLVGINAYSRMGNKLGVVESFEIDCESGAISKIHVGSGASFVAESFLFFTTEFVFVDTSIQPAESEDAGEEDEGDADDDDDADADDVDDADDGDEGGAVADDGDADGGAVSDGDDADGDDADGGAVSDGDDAVSEATAEDEFQPSLFSSSNPPVPTGFSLDAGALKTMLVGSVLAEDIQSFDGLFQASAGTILSEQAVQDADDHGAILLLAAAIES